MLLIQQGPADTMIYMIAGYGVIFSVMAVYLASLIIRERNLRRDLEVLTEMEKSNTVESK